MRKSYLSLIAILSFGFAGAQNQVLNPGFDSYITCPGFGQFSNVYINDWNKPTIASSDYYHYNCASIQPTVQVPRSGEGYAGIIAYNFGTEYREYITGTISPPLVAGQTYNVKFYASLNDNYIQAIAELGAYLSVTAPGPFSNALHINVIPQIENTGATITDTSVWKVVSGQYTATGGESFITIGNFRDDNSTTISQPGTVGSFGAYYFIDDVSVIPDSTTSLHNLSTGLQTQIYYYNNQLYVTTDKIPSGDYPLQLKGYNTSGQMVFSNEVSKSEIRITLDHLPAGIYVFTLSHENRVLNECKLLIND